MTTLYYVDVWDQDGERHEDAIDADSPEDAARDLGSRVFPDGLDLSSDAWRAETEFREVFGPWIWLPCTGDCGGSVKFRKREVHPMTLHRILSAAARARGPWDHLPPAPVSVEPERRVWLSSLADQLGVSLRELAGELLPLQQSGALAASGARLARHDIADDTLTRIGSEITDGIATYHLLCVRR